MDARSATALLLMTVSVSLVFAAGRMSAWIVPVTGTPRAVADGQEKVKHPDAAPAKPALAMKSRAAPSSPGVIEAAIGDAKTSTDLATPSVVANSGETSGAVARTVAEGVLRGVEVAARQIPPAPDQSVVSPEPAAPKAPVALNAGADGFRDDRQPMAAGRQEPDRSADDTAGQCERRYSSFRRSDGTYQPFDGGPRKRCPLLR